MINIKLPSLWLQAACYRLQGVWVWVMSDELSLATCRL